MAACAGPNKTVDRPDRDVTGLPEPSIERAHKQLTDSVIDLPGVAGVGIGECDGRPCLKVMVEEMTPELSEAIPNSVDGFTVEVEETGPFRALEPN